MVATFAPPGPELELGLSAKSWEFGRRMFMGDDHLGIGIDLLLVGPKLGGEPACFRRGKGGSRGHGRVGFGSFPMVSVTRRRGGVEGGIAYNQFAAPPKIRALQMIVIGEFPDAVGSGKAPMALLELSGRSIGEDTR
jgi:hypothetical protein